MKILKIRRAGFGVILLGYLLLVMQSAIAEGTKLSGDEIKKLFIGKTVDGYNPIKDKHYKLFTKNDSEAIHQNARRSKETDWKINGDKHCMHLRKYRCGTIHDMGNGVYHKMKNGKHINTLKNFREGNDL